MRNCGKKNRRILLGVLAVLSALIMASCVIVSTTDGGDASDGTQTKKTTSATDVTVPPSEAELRLYHAAEVTEVHISDGSSGGYQAECRVRVPDLTAYYEECAEQVTEDPDSPAFEDAFYGLLAEKCETAEKTEQTYILDLALYTDPDASDPDWTEDEVIALVQEKIMREQLELAMYREIYSAENIHAFLASLPEEGGEE